MQLPRNVTALDVDDLIERYLICKELAAGATVKQVCDKLGVASATVVRGNRVLKYGAGGMTRFLE